MAWRAQSDKSSLLVAHYAYVSRYGCITAVLDCKFRCLHVWYRINGEHLLHWIKASCGLVVSSLEPKSPAPVPTPDALFKAAKATSSDIVFCVPSFIEVCRQFQSVS